MKKINLDVGSKIIIRSDLEPFNMYGIYSFQSLMKQYTGKVATITKITDMSSGDVSSFYIDLDKTCYYYTPEMVDVNKTYSIQNSFIPKMGDLYWSINISLNGLIWISNLYYHNDSIDKKNIKYGNCFKTRALARIALKDIKKVLTTSIKKLD